MVHEAGICAQLTGKKGAYLHEAGSQFSLGVQVRNAFRIAASSCRDELLLVINFGVELVEVPDQHILLERHRWWRIA